jgi:hypothetical protein
MSLQFQKGPDNVLFDLSTKMNTIICKFNDLLEEFKKNEHNVDLLKKALDNMDVTFEDWQS